MTLKISHRLRTIATFLPKGSYFTDVGTDHAYLPCYVCLNDPQAHVIAGEVREGPYNRAIQTVKSYYLTDRIDVRLGHGLRILNQTTDPIQQLVIAGMGGSLMKDILNDGYDLIKTVQRMILQPNVGEKQVRQWLYNHSFAIVEEVILEENGHLYEIIVADFNEQQPYSYSPKKRQKQFMFGPKLLNESSSLFNRKWSHELKHLHRVVRQIKEGQPSNKHVNKFLTKIQWIEEVLTDGEVHSQ